MKMQITATTDRQYLGHIFDSDDNPIVLDNDVNVNVERVLTMSDGLRFISSSYIIDAQEI
jgi:hypothetical protein